MKKAVLNVMDENPETNTQIIADPPMPHFVRSAVVSEPYSKSTSSFTKRLSPAH